MSVPNAPTLQGTCGACCVVYTAKLNLDPKGISTIPWFRAINLFILGITLIIAAILVGRQQKRRREIHSFHRNLLFVTIGVVVMHMLGGILPITMASIVLSYGYSPIVPWYLYAIAACIAGGTWAIAWFVCYMFYITPHRTSLIKMMMPTIIIFVLFSLSNFLGSELGKETAIWWGYIAVELVLIPWFLFCFLNGYISFCGLYPRPMLRWWSLYCLLIHACFLACFLLIDLQQPAEYCLAIVCESVFSASFALFLYFILYFDAKYLAEETAPLLLLHNEGSLNLIDWEDLEMESKTESLMGAGSQGTVYKAFWGTEAVAIKVIDLLTVQDWAANPKSREENEDALSALSREASYLSELRHPSIVQFYGITKLPDAKETYGIVTKFMQHNLFAVIQEQNMSEATPIAWPTRMKWVRDLAFGMKYLHSKGINHGDIKSMNVLLSADLQNAQLCDFGSAGRRATATQHTPQWSAPEVLSGMEYTSASDVYSFGVLVWEIVSFQHPYQRLSVADATLAIRAGKIPSAFAKDAVPNDVPTVLSTIIESCLEKRQANRPTSEALCTYLSP